MTTCFFQQRLSQLLRRQHYVEARHQLDNALLGDRATEGEVHPRMNACEKRICDLKIKLQETESKIKNREKIEEVSTALVFN